MTHTRLDVDRLLRELMGGEPLPEVDSRLRSGLRHAWIRAATVDTRALPAGRGPLPARLGAAAAALMVAVGLLAQLVLPLRVAAASWSGRQVALWVSLQLAGVSAMEAVVDGRDRDARPVRYHVEWQRPGRTRVRIERSLAAPEVAVRELWLPPRPRLAGPGFVTEASPALRDPRLRPVEAYLSPERVAEIVTGDWQEAPAAADEGPVRFTVARADGSSVLVTLDPRHELPVRIEERAAAGARPTRTARLRWMQDETLWRRLHAPAHGR